MVEREGGEQLLNVHEVREFDDDPCCIVWPAARVLLLWLQTNLEAQLGATLRGAKIIELGAGTGFLALSLANAGAQNILAVEGAEHGFMNLEHNISTSRTTAVTPLQWDWEKQPDIPSEVPPVLDLVLGSDIVYPRHYNGDALCGTVFRPLTRGLEVEPLVLLSLCDRAIISDSSTASSSLRVFLKHARSGRSRCPNFRSARQSFWQLWEPVRVANMKIQVPHPGPRAISECFGSRRQMSATSVVLNVARLVAAVMWKTRR